MGKFRIKLMGLPLLLLASILPTSASADETPATSVDSLTAVAGLSTVAVTGNGTFTAPAVDIGVDGTNDHTGAQAPLPTGTDLTVAKIRAYDPKTLRFELEVANMSDPWRDPRGHHLHLALHRRIGGVRAASAPFVHVDRPVERDVSTTSGIPTFISEHVRDQPHHRAGDLRDSRLTASSPVTRWCGSSPPAWSA